MGAWRPTYTNAVEVASCRLAGGLFRVFCTVDGDTVFEWQPGTWTFNGTSTEVATVPNLFRPNR